MWSDGVVLMCLFLIQRQWIGKKIFAGCEAGTDERGFRVPWNSSRQMLLGVSVSAFVLGGFGMGSLDGFGLGCLVVRLSLQGGPGTSIGAPCGETGHLLVDVVCWGIGLVWVNSQEI